MERDVDFDTALLLLADRAAGGVWDDLRRSLPHLEIPALSSVVLPRPSLLSDVLAARPAVLVGDPQLGKTTIALLAAAVQQLELGRVIRQFDGPEPVIAALEVTGGDGAVVIADTSQ